MSWTQNACCYNPILLKLEVVMRLIVLVHTIALGPTTSNWSLYIGFFIPQCDLGVKPIAYMVGTFTAPIF